MLLTTDDDNTDDRSESFLGKLTEFIGGALVVIVGVALALAAMGGAAFLVKLAWSWAL